MTDDAAPRPMDRKRWWKLPVTTPPRDVAKLFRAALADDYPDELWAALPRMADAHLATLIPCLRRDGRFKAQVLVAAYAENGVRAAREAAEFFAFVRHSGNVPSALARIKKKQLKSSTAFAKAAARAVLARKTEPDGEIIVFWTMLLIASRAQPRVFDVLEARVKKWDDQPTLDRVLARVRKAAAR